MVSIIMDKSSPDINRILLESFIKGDYNLIYEDLYMICDNKNLGNDVLQKVLDTIFVSSKYREASGEEHIVHDNFLYSLSTLEDLQWLPTTKEKHIE